MYYYIIEPPKGKIIFRPEKIKDILGDLGIAGETVSPNAARSIEELAHLGIVKGYSTIVAVGSESLVNRVTTVLATEKSAQNTVLGIIPDNFESALARKIGVSDLRSACNSLKLRKLQTVDVCLIEPNKYFLTEAIVENPHRDSLFFSIENLKGKALVNKVHIRPGLKVYFHDPSFEGGTGKKFFQWLFGKKEKDIYSSFFHSKKIRFEGEKHNLSIRVSGEIVAKTPATFVNRQKILKIIVARDTIKQEKK